MATGLVLLHGLPTGAGSDPFVCLQVLRHALEDYLPADNIYPYHWADALYQQARIRAIRPLKEGTLRSLAAPLLAGALADLQRQRPDIEQWGLGGYSSGGWIANQYLVWKAARQWPEVSFAFTIAAPRQNIHGLLLLRGRTITIPLWQLATADGRVETDDTGRAVRQSELANALAPMRLHTVFSSADNTVWPDNCRFAESYAARLVSQLELPRGLPDNQGHDEICNDLEMIISVTTWLRSIKVI